MVVLKEDIETSRKNESNEKSNDGLFVEVEMQRNGGKIKIAHDTEERAGVKPTSIERGAHGLSNGMSKSKIERRPQKLPKVASWHRAQKSEELKAERREYSRFEL